MGQPCQVVWDMCEGVVVLVLVLDLVASSLEGIMGIW
jgi:hypothetical protein